MNNVKFRAWDKEEQSMIVDEQSFIPAMVTNKGVFKLNPKHEEDDWILLPPERFELMQSTGLKDKNGVEVYEGDILKLHVKAFSDEHEPVTFPMDDFTFDLAYITQISQFIDNNYENEDVTDSIEIIGNAYENKELLK